jgi:hypothetical protein
VLKKIAGVAIQLYEADFNCFNQFDFSKHAMQTLIKRGYIPEELFSHKDSTAKDAKFNKILMANLSRQARRPMMVEAFCTSNNANQCSGRFMQDKEKGGSKQCVWRHMRFQSGSKVYQYISVKKCTISFYLPLLVTYC